MNMMNVHRPTAKPPIRAVTEQNRQAARKPLLASNLSPTF